MSDSLPYPVSTLSIPNPFFEGRNQVYVIHSDPVTIIDTGIATERARQALQQDLTDHGVDLASIGRVILTHKHIDHLGSAWWLQQQSNADIYIHAIEEQSVTDVDPEGNRWRNMIVDRFSMWNVPDDARPGNQDNQRNIWELESARATTIEDGDSIDLGHAQLEILHTPGHTKGSVCIRYGDILFSGDHVLPDISPNIGGGDLKHSGLLNEFLQSLRRCQKIAPDIREVMPGHGDPFSNLHERCQGLYDHHEQRLNEVSDILNDQGPQSVYSVATQMFGEIRDMHVVLGCAEAQAHLEFLVDAGRVAVDRDTYAAV